MALDPLQPRLDELWEELEDFLHAHHGNSERHAKVRSAAPSGVCAASSVAPASSVWLPPDLCPHSQLFDLVQVLSKESPSNGRPRKQPMRALDYTTEAMDVEQT